MQELSIQQIQASYFNENALRLPSYQMYRLSTSQGRYYYTFVDGKPKFYISVTHLLGRYTPANPHLIKWMAQKGEEAADRQKNQRAAYGTLMHIVNEELMINGGIDLDQLPTLVDEYFEENETHGADKSEFLRELQKDVLSFAQFMIDREVEPIAVEPILKSDEFGTAGAIDLFCKMKFNGKQVYAIVDEKGGKKGFYPDNELQLAYYKHAILEEWPEFKGQDIMLFNWCGSNWQKKPTYTLKNQTGKHSYDELKIYSDLYRMDAAKHPIGKTNLIQVSGKLEVANGNLVENYSLVNINDKISNHEQNQKQEHPTENTLTNRREDPSRRKNQEQSGQGISDKPRLL